jgi:hypothetical protein
LYLGGNVVQAIGLKKAFDIVISTRWHWVLLCFIFGMIVGGFFWGIFATVIYLVFFTILTKSFKVLCMNRFGKGYCGNLVEKAENFCSRCGLRAPWWRDHNEESDEPNQPP